jgi:hypothetical protein
MYGSNSLPESVHKDIISNRISAGGNRNGLAIAIRVVWTSVMAASLVTIAQTRLYSQAEHDEPRASEPAVEPAASRFALAFKASTLGLGPEAGMRLTRHLNVRVGVNAFDYRRNLSDDGVAYDSAFRLRSVQALVDWFPFAQSFHLSAGLLVYNGNHVSANASVPLNQIISAGDENVISNPTNPITGRATSTVRPVAPMIGIGFGNLVAHARHIGFSVDFGVVFQGAPHSTLTFNGSACDVSGMFCADVAGDPSIQSQAISETHTINRDLFFLRYYPFLSLELGYRF